MKRKGYKVQLNDAEHEEIVVYAKSKGHTFSSYVRYAALAEARRQSYRKRKREAARAVPTGCEGGLRVIRHLTAEEMSKERVIVPGEDD